MTAHVLTSALLASHRIPHCFSTRIGGVSTGIFASLNLGNPGDLPAEQRDPASNIRENFRRILDTIGCEGRALTQVHQVHGGDVASAFGPGPAPAAPDPKADGVLTDDPARVLAIRSADCAPILLATPDGRLVAAVHAGWRGIIAGILPNTIAAMRQRGATEILAAVGPCIGPDYFEVGPEVSAEFHRLFASGAADPAPVLRLGPGDRSLVDLKETLRRQLVAAGVARFDISPHCTYRDADLFFSHRRERGMTGRTAALIAPRKL